ncbi:hypothetical protein HHI36_008415 [Cryptolaemus montrouzieri]|uniref:EGF-like domain-containing protein n=1 Tax=Cryptolaemus montrouzieri TaxID=559131 RepID=A0ABD2MSE0_9CUCU
MVDAFFFTLMEIDFACLSNIEIQYTSGSTPIKTTTGNGEKSDLPQHGLVRDGTPCGDNLICLNQTCTSIFPYIDQLKCPTTHNNQECSGRGYCTNTNRCYCNVGWTGSDCSIEEEVVPSPALPTRPSLERPSTNLSSVMKKKETPYGRYQNIIIFINLFKIKNSSCRNLTNNDLSSSKRRK